MEPFQDLLKHSDKKSKHVYWDEALQNVFEESKQIICNEAKSGLAYFDISKKMLVMTDWSTIGIGFIIMQKHCKCSSDDDPYCCNGGWKLVLSGSRSLKGAEQNYAVIEGEALAIVWC